MGRLGGAGVVGANELREVEGDEPAAAGDGGADQREDPRECRACFVDVEQPARRGGVEVTTEFPQSPRPGRFPPLFDFYVATYRTGKAGNYPDSPIVKTVGRGGALFAVIRGRVSPAAKQNSPDHSGVSHRRRDDHVPR